MKFKLLVATMLMFSSAVFISCSDDDTYGNWIAKSAFEALPRTEAVSFSIANIGYYGLGVNDETYFNDFWQYDPELDLWTQLGDFPGVARAYCVSTNSDTKGYMGLGYDGSDDRNDFWEYDPQSDTWTQLIDFGQVSESDATLLKKREELVRREATAFSIGDYVYVGTGANNYNATGSTKTARVDNKDFYKYSITNKTWTSIGFAGDKRRCATTVVLDGRAYVISGLTSSGTTLNDFWSFDPVTEAWTELDKLNDEFSGDEEGKIQRSNAVAFTLGGKVYLAGGARSGSSMSTIYEWNPATRLWRDKNAIEVKGQTWASQGAGCFVLNQEAYILCGNSGTKYYDYLVKFDPYADEDSDD